MNLSMLLQRKQTLSVVLFFFVFISIGQTVKNFTISDGLPGNSIKCLYKASNGLMWIGTETGLCTFDGEEFKIIGEEQGLKYNLIWKIAEDANKNIWLSTYGNGIAKFDGKRFIYYNKKNGLVNDAVRTLYCYKKKNWMLFGTEDGLSIFNGKKFKNIKFKTNNWSKKFQVNFISEYNNKILFTIDYENLYEIQINDKNIENVTVQKFKNLKTQNYTGFVYKDDFFNRNFFNQLEALNLKLNQKIVFEKSPVIWDYAVDNYDNIYTACWDVNTPTGGVFKLQNRKLTDLSKQFDLPTCQFWCLYFDKSTEELWAGSVDKGIFVLDLSQKISFLNKRELGLDKPEINSFYIDKSGDFWYGGNNFIAKKNLKGSVSVLTNEKLTNQVSKLIKNRFESKINDVKITLKKSKSFVCNSIKKDTSGTIWAMTNYGLIALDDKLNVIKFQYLAETSGLFDFIDPENILLSQNYYFGYKIPIKNLNEFKKILYKGKPIEFDATKICKTKQGLWIASYSKGLFLFEKEKLQSMMDLGFLNDKNITEVIEDDNQNIIIGTVGGKVYFSKWKNEKLAHFKSLSPNKDLIGNSIFFIRKYNDYYFIGTNRGINIIKDFEIYKFIDFSENLTQTRYTDAQIDYKRKLLILSYENGLINLDLEKVLKKQIVNSPIYIKSIRINQKEYPISSNLNLEHAQNNIEINFNSNNLYNAIKNRYRYKIIGLSNEWSSYSSENNIKLFGLKSGKYQLIIEGKNIGTNEIIAPISLSITIHPPFWQTGWFIGFVFVVLTFGMYLYVKRKINNIKHKAELEKRIAETKLQALQSQMNPHFVFNAMNSIQNFVIDNKVDDALFYIGEFSKLMRQTLLFSSKKYVYLHEEIDYIKRYIKLENLRKKNKVDVKIEWNDIINIHGVEIPPMLIEPLVENVFIHAFDQTIENPKLHIMFMMIENKLFCTVTDNGKGFKAQNKESKGLKLVEERIQLLSSTNLKKIKFENTTKGTSVKIEIPLR